MGMRVYRTKSGDTWDMIAYKLYKDCRYTEELMQANREHLTTFIFSAGVELKVPEVESKAVNLPPWKR